MEIWEEHEFVFHYTNGAGLKGILESQALHATHYEFLNDRTEMYALRERLEVLVGQGLLEAIQKRLSRDGFWDAEVFDLQGPNLAKYISNEIVNAIYRVTLDEVDGFVELEPHIFSFCSHRKDAFAFKNGLLSQWRGYASISGYAIVFETEKLARLIENEFSSYHYRMFSFDRVVYGNQEKEFLSRFPNLAKVAGGVNEAIASKKMKGRSKIYKDAFEALVECMSLYKHEAFEEEGEVRIVFSPMSKAYVRAIVANGGKIDKKKKIKERLVRKNMASYISILGSGRRLPIVRIIVGPHPDSELRKRRLEHYLRAQGLKIEVVCSQTPLVG